MFKKLYLAVLGVLLFSALAFGQKRITADVWFDDLPVVRIDLDTDEVIQTYQLTQDYDEAIVYLRVDTVAADSVAYYIVLDVSPDNIHWTTHDSSALNNTADSVLTFKRFANVGSQYVRIRINPTAANSGTPDRPVEGFALFRKKTISP